MFTVFKILPLPSLLFVISAFAHSANTLKTETINFSNTGPIVSLFTITRPDFISFQAPETFSFKNQLSLSNYISSTAKDDEQFKIDGETWLAVNTFEYQIHEQLNIGVSIPLVKHSGGSTDSFIYDFHDLLQLPQNGRTEENEDDFRWILNHDGKNLVNEQDELSGLGDIYLTAYLSSPSKPSVMWSFMTKFPTGKYEKQSGSENFDFGVSVLEMNPQWFSERSFLEEADIAFWYGAGISFIGELDALKSLKQNQFVTSLRSGFAYSPIKKWQLKCQIDTHSPLYDSEIRELGWIPVQISFSSWHQLYSSGSFEFAIMEDIRPRSTPDVIFQTTFQTYF